MTYAQPYADYCLADCRLDFILASLEALDTSFYAYAI